MRKIILLLLTSCSIQYGFAQNNVGIGTAMPHASAQLDVSSSNKGLLVPRLTSMQRLTIVSPAIGLLVFDTNTNSFWYFNGADWTNLATSLTSWNVNGNTGTNPSTHFIGTNDNADLRFKLNNTSAGLLSNNGNVFWGLRSGLSNTTGYSNVGIGIDALKLNTDRSNLVAIGDSSLHKNGTGATQTHEATDNTAIGTKSLYSNTTGFYNTAAGAHSLSNNTTGFENTAMGWNSMPANTTGSYNVAIGSGALLNNSSGQLNIAIGKHALSQNTTGNTNTANGWGALYINTTGFSNIAVGVAALQNNTIRNNLVAIGDSALLKNGIGATPEFEHAKNNTAIGSKALYANTIGFDNTATGFNALRENINGLWNTATGSYSLWSNTTGSSNTATGRAALRYNLNGSNNTATGWSALAFNSSGDGNTANGFVSLENNTEGKYNSAFGYYTLNANTTGYSNVAVGGYTLYKNTIRSNLVAIGDSALYNNGTGATVSGHSIHNTAIGSKALYGNTTGFDNTANGFNALYTNSTGAGNTATGSNALRDNSTGSGNTAVGNEVLLRNTAGTQNTGVGLNSMNFNSGGVSNTGTGTYSLFSNTSGNYNTAAGSNALVTNTDGSENSGLGYYAITGSSSLINATAIGAKARVDCSNCMVLGSINGVNSATSNVKVGIGTTLPQQLLSVSGAMNVDQDNANNGTLNSSLTFGSGSGEGIGSKRTAGGNQFGLDFYASSIRRISITNDGLLRVYNAPNTRYAQLYHSDPNGNLHLDAFGGGTNYISWLGGSGLHVGNGTSSGYGPVNASAFVVSSSLHVKKDISDMRYGLSQILQLQGKEYKYINDSTNRNEIGLIAEEVEKILPEVVYRNTPDKKITGIDYSKLVPVLVEAIKEQQKQIDELKKMMKQLLDK